MKLFSYTLQGGASRLGAWRRGEAVDLGATTLLDVLHAGAMDDMPARIEQAPLVPAPETIDYLPLIPRPGKLVCVGLNYRAHRDEAGAKPLPTNPDFFLRHASSLAAHGGALWRPRISPQFDYEGELAVVIGRPGRHIEPSLALAHVAGYAVFNDASVRDYQFRSSQWTLGKNFDRTGAFGPELVTPDELPRPVAEGLRIETRLNGEVVQSASTSDLIFDVATLIAQISEVSSLEAGDVIVTGTPGGVGMARTPPLYMRPGDVVEVEIEGIGRLRNTVEDEPAGRTAGH